MLYVLYFTMYVVCTRVHVCDDIITSAIAAPLPAVCISIYVHRTLVVMATLVQMPRLMCVECVEGTGAHAL